MDRSYTLFDPTELIENCGNKVELAHKVLRAYLRLSPNLVRRVCEGLQHQNLEEIKIGAHTLRGSSATVGAKPVSEICRQIESQGTDFPKQRLNELEQAFLQTAREIERYLEA